MLLEFTDVDGLETWVNAQQITHIKASIKNPDVVYFTHIYVAGGGHIRVVEETASVAAHVAEALRHG